jgi:hypothetical protein
MPKTVLQWSTGHRSSMRFCISSRSRSWSVNRGRLDNVDEGEGADDSEKEKPLDGVALGDTTSVVRKEMLSAKPLALFHSWCRRSGSLLIKRRYASESVSEAGDQYTVDGTNSARQASRARMRNAWTSAIGNRPIYNAAVNHSTARRAPRIRTCASTWSGVYLYSRSSRARWARACSGEVWNTNARSRRAEHDRRSRSTLLNGPQD